MGKNKEDDGLRNQILRNTKAGCISQDMKTKLSKPSPQYYPRQFVKPFNGSHHCIQQARKHKPVKPFLCERYRAVYLFDCLIVCKSAVLHLLSNRHAPYL
jgi:hypothetical protein